MSALKRFITVVTIAFDCSLRYLPGCLLIQPGLVLYAWLVVPLLLLPFGLLLLLIKCFCKELSFCGVIDGSDDKKTCFLPVVMSFVIALLSALSVVLQLSTRLATNLYLRDSSVPFFPFYAILCPAFAWLIFIAGVVPCLGVSAIPIKLCKFSCDTYGLTIICFVVLVSLVLCAAPLTALLPLSDYTVAVHDDFWLRDTTCYFASVYNGEHDSMVGLLTRLGF